VAPAHPLQLLAGELVDVEEGDELALAGVGREAWFENQASPQLIHIGVVIPNEEVVDRTVPLCIDEAVHLLIALEALHRAAAVGLHRVLRLSVLQAASAQEHYEALLASHNRLLWRFIVDLGTVLAVEVGTLSSIRLFLDTVQVSPVVLLVLLFSGHVEMVSWTTLHQVRCLSGCLAGGGAEDPLFKLLLLVELGDKAPLVGRLEHWVSY